MAAVSGAQAAVLTIKPKLLGFLAGAAALVMVVNATSATPYDFTVNDGNGHTETFTLSSSNAISIANLGNYPTASPGFYFTGVTTILNGTIETGQTINFWTGGSSDANYIFHYDFGDYWLGNLGLQAPLPYINADCNQNARG